MTLPPNTAKVELLAYRQHVAARLREGVRLDGRAFTEIRQPTVVRESSNNNNNNSDDADSAWLGDALSSVVYSDAAGCCLTASLHAVFGPPLPQTQDEGRLNVRVHAPFLIQQGFMHGGGTSNMAASSGSSDVALRQLEGFLAQVLWRCVPRDQLMIVVGEACWVLTVSITILNADGGLRAAALHAAVAALHRAELPCARLPDGSVVEQRVLALRHLPVAAELCVLGGTSVRLLADATAMEELATDGRMTVVVDEDDRIIALDQHGTYPLMHSVLAAAMDLTTKLAAQLRPIISA